MTEPGACNRFAELLDIYLDGELPASEMSEVARHLEQCPGCARELEERNAFRQRLRNAAHSADIPAQLTANVRRRLSGNQPRRSLSPARRSRSWALPLVAAAAVLVISFAAWQLARRSLTVEGQDDFLARTSIGFAQIMRVGLNDHVHCAVFRKYPAHPASLAEMAALLGSKYADLEPVFAAHLPAGMKVVMAHHCSFRGRQYVHLIARGEAGLMSLVITRRDQGEAFAGDLRAIASEGGTAIYASSANGFSIAGFQTAGHFVYIVSNLPEPQNSSEMETMARGIANVLGRAS